VHVEVSAHVGREPHDVLVAHRIALVAQPGERGVEVDGVPQRDAVQHQSQRAELVLHALVVGATQIPAAAVEDVSGQVVAAFLQVAVAVAPLCGLDPVLT